jgi:hypothetical protein
MSMSDSGKATGGNEGIGEDHFDGCVVPERFRQKREQI